MTNIGILFLPHPMTNDSDTNSPLVNSNPDALSITLSLLLITTTNLVIVYGNNRKQWHDEYNTLTSEFYLIKVEQSITELYSHVMMAV